MEEQRPYVSWELVGSFMTDAFAAAGVPPADAAICADVLMESDRRGIESHGVNRFKPVYLDRIEAGILRPVTRCETLRETPTTLVVDAHDGMGMVASHRMMRDLIAKAREHGLAMGAVRNSSHYGIAGYWGSMAAGEGMLGVTGTNARPTVAPTFGTQGMLGTNPLTFVFPTDEDHPFCFDCATSIVQNGRIEFLARSGLPTPEGMVIGPDGSYLTDSAAILKSLTRSEAALLPLGGAGEEFAGHKGYGFATVVEILSAALSGGLFMQGIKNVDEQGQPRPYHLGHFFAVINPEFFMGEELFRTTAGTILRELRASRRAANAERIYVAGDKEWLAWQERRDKGVPMGESVQADFIAVRDRFQLPYHFPFE